MTVLYCTYSAIDAFRSERLYLFFWCLDFKEIEI